MVTNDTVVLALAWLAGGALGAFFFGGLWWTVQASVASARPALWVFGSLMLRMGVTLTGFYVVSGDDWRRMVSCLLGFVMARQVVTRLTRLPEDNPAHPMQEVDHAP
jgi:F1F0 ATPase subunit 2